MFESLIESSLVKAFGILKHLQHFNRKKRPSDRMPVEKMVTMVWKIVNSMVLTDNLADILQTCTIYLNLGNEIS